MRLFFLPRHPNLNLPLAFDVFFSSQGSQGLLGRASKQQLDNVFGTHKDVDVITKILQDGREQKGQIASGSGGIYNATRGNNDNRNVAPH